MVLRISASLLVLAVAAAIVVSGSLAGTKMSLDTSRQPLRLQTIGALPSLERTLPGESASSRLAVRNLGREAGRLSLVLEVDGSASSRADFRFELRAGGRVLFSGSPLQQRSVRIDVGRIAAGGLRALQLKVSLARDARAQDLRLQVSSHWQAEQLA
jgi:hypothetical protein